MSITTEAHINEFVSFLKQKDGSYKLQQSISQEGNIYRWLARLGFGRAKIGQKTVTFRRGPEGIKWLSPEAIKNFFLDYLMELPYSQLPEGLTRNNMGDWFFQKQPFKFNGLYRHCLKSSLNAAEIEAYRIQTDADYAKRQKIAATITYVINNGFTMTPDEVGSFIKGNAIYYRELQPKEFLLLIHHNPDLRIAAQCFDYCRANYHNAQQIGRIKNQAAVNACQRFDITEDLESFQANFVD